MAFVVLFFVFIGRDVLTAGVEKQRELHQEATSIEENLHHEGTPVKSRLPRSLSTDDFKTRFAKRNTEGAIEGHEFLTVVRETDETFTTTSKSTTRHTAKGPKKFTRRFRIRSDLDRFDEKKLSAMVEKSDVDNAKRFLRTKSDPETLLSPRITSYRKLVTHHRQFPTELMRRRLAATDHTKHPLVSAYYLKRDAAGLVMNALAVQHAGVRNDEIRTMKPMLKDARNGRSSPRVIADYKVRRDGDHTQQGPQLQSFLDERPTAPLGEEGPALGNEAGSLDSHLEDPANFELVRTDERRHKRIRRDSAEAGASSSTQGEGGFVAANKVSDSDNTTFSEATRQYTLNETTPKPIVRTEKTKGSKLGKRNLYIGIVCAGLLALVLMLVIIFGYLSWKSSNKSEEKEPLTPGAEDRPPSRRHPSAPSAGETASTAALRALVSGSSMGLSTAYTIPMELRAPGPTGKTPATPKKEATQAHAKTTDKDIAKTPAAVLAKDATQTPAAATAKDATQTPAAATAKDATQTSAAVPAKDATKTLDSAPATEATQTPVAVPAKDATQTSGKAK